MEYTEADGRLVELRQDYTEHLASLVVLYEKTEFSLSIFPDHLATPDQKVYQEYLDVTSTGERDSSRDELLDAIRQLRKAILAPFWPTIERLVKQFEPNQPITLHDFVECDQYRLSLDDTGQAVVDEHATGCTRGLLPQASSDFKLPPSLPHFQANEVSFDTYDAGSRYLPYEVIAGGRARFLKPATHLCGPEFTHELTTYVSLFSNQNPILKIPILEAVVTTSKDPTRIIGFLLTWIDGINIADAPAQVRASCMPQWHTTIIDTALALHKLDIIWGDVNAHNVMIDRAVRAWLVDLGAGYRNERKPAPETISKHVLDPAMKRKFDEKRRKYEIVASKRRELEAVDTMMEALVALGPGESQQLGSFYYMPSELS